MIDKRWQESAIGLMLLLSLGAAALALHAGGRKSEHWGPRILERTASGEVWLVLDQELLIASQSGELRRRVPLSALPGPVNAIVGLPDGGNRGRMLVGVINQPDWLVMDADGQVLERIRTSGIDVPFNETFHLAVAPDGRIAMSTGGDHRVLLFDAKGKYLAESEPGLFRYANGLWYENGQWRVVDTNHGQLRFLNGESLKPESALPVPKVRGAWFPALARHGKGAQDSMTLSEMRNGMQYGVILEMSSDGQLLHEYRSQAENPQPTDFLWLDEQLLMADSDDFSLQLFDRHGNFLGQWGDGGIGAALRTAHDDRLWWSAILRGAQAGAIILGLLALIWYFVGKQRAESLPKDTPNVAFRQTDVAFFSGNAALLDWFRLFWPVLLLVLVILAIPQLAILFLVLFAGGLKNALQAAWFVPVSLAVGLAFTGVTIWMLISVQKLMGRRLNEPRFEPILSARWLRWSMRSRAVRDALEAGETVQETLMVYTKRLFPVFNMNVWILTNRRVLIFALGTGGGGKLLASMPRRQVAASVEPARGWFWWTDAFGKMVLRSGDGRTYQGRPGSPVTARRMSDLLALAHGKPRSLPTYEQAPKTDKTVHAGFRSPSPTVAFLISLSLPGAAQMMQNRFVLGLVLLTIMLFNVAFVLAPVMLGWIGHFYDVPLIGGVYSLAFAAIWALLAAVDAAHYARQG